jgi:hypothetical protein
MKKSFLFSAFAVALAFSSYSHACTSKVVVSTQSPARAVMENVMQNWLSAGLISNDSLEWCDESGNTNFCLNASSDQNTALIQAHLNGVLSGFSDVSITNE